MLNFLYSGETCYDAWFRNGAAEADLEAEDAQILHPGVTRMDRIRDEHIKRRSQGWASRR